MLQIHYLNVLSC